jgi:catechol 2,3-dioxygenase-like lactoylglutathione lyase family enzyme
MFKRIDHVGVVVDSLEEAQRFLASLQLTAVRNVEISGRLRSVFYQCGETQIEIIEVTDPAERAERLGEARARIEHLAMEVEDLDATAQALSALGVSFTGEPLKLGGTLNAWTVADTCDGVMYQLIQKAST